MTIRPFAWKWAALFAFMAGASLSSCSDGSDCTDGSFCQVFFPPSSFNNMTLTASDAGKAFRVGVGEWVSLRLINQGAAAGSSSDPTVLKIAKLPQESPDNPFVFASFQAVGPGSAQLTFGYLICAAASSDPCSYDVYIRVVQFPKATITIQSLYAETHFHVRVGNVVRISAPSSPPQASPESIDAPDVIGWAVEPIHLSGGNWMEAALIALTPGTAHVQAGACSGPQPVCTNPWRLTFVVN
jgi:hypothetical protein